MTDQPVEPLPWMREAAREITHDPALYLPYTKIIAKHAPGSPVPESAFNEGRLFQFLRMKKERPIDPLCWDMHEENNLREGLPAPSVPESAPELVDAREQLRLAHLAIGGNPAIYLHDKIRILKEQPPAPVSASAWIEEVYRVVCPACKEGVPIFAVGGVIWHYSTKNSTRRKCRGAAIRQRFNLPASPAEKGKKP